MPGLRETLEAATPGEWLHQTGPDDDWGFVALGESGGHGTYGFEASHDIPQAINDARLIALTPQLAALCLSAEKACKRAERAASRAHDVMWAMDFDKTAAGRAEREEWKRLREQASNEIWKLHEQLRPLLARLDRLGKEQT